MLRLGEGFDPKAFRDGLTDAVRANPILSAPIRRALGLGVPEYRLDLARGSEWPRVSLHEAPRELTRPGEPLAALPELFFERLNEERSARRGELLRVDVVPRGGRHPGTDVAFTWLHMLFDGSGSERFLCHLEARRSGVGPAVPPADGPGAGPDLALPASSRERGRMAMTWQRGMSDLGALRVCSLAGPGHRGQQDLTYEVLSFPEAASASILGRAHSLAGFLTPTLFFLAAAIRAHDSVLRMRGTVPEGYVVPLPVDLRPKGGEGGVFRSRVSLIWLRVAADRTRDPALLLEGLKETRRRAIREHQVANGVAAMDYARYAPARLYALMTRRPMRGELCSFMFAWTAEFCPELRHFYGADVLDGFHAPSVPVSPGSSVVFSMRDGRLNVTHVRQRGVLSDGELERFREVLVRDLTGAG